jgi:hypothetical protein
MKSIFFSLILVNVVSVFCPGQVTSPNASASYTHKIKDLTGQISISARNITNETYMAFTEPDPDGNSYQPGPGREVFMNIKVLF